MVTTFLGKRSIKNYFLNFDQETSFGQSFSVRGIRKHNVSGFTFLAGRLVGKNALINHLNLILFVKAFLEGGGKIKSTKLLT